jgi:hypothetical protein
VSHLQRSLSTPTNHLRRELLLQCVGTPAASGPVLCSQQDGVVWCGFDPPNAQRRLKRLRADHWSNVN